MTGRTPPGPRGWRAWQFYRSLERDSYRALRSLQREYGDVVEVNVGMGPRLTLLVGRDANQYVLSDAKDSMRCREAYRGLIPVDGPTALVVSDGPEHQRRRALVQPAFRPRTLAAQQEVIGDEAAALVGALPDGETVDVYPLYRRSVRRSVIRLLFGEHLRENADQIGDMLEAPLEFVNKPTYRQIKLNVPGSSYHRTLKGRQACDQLIDAEVRRRRGLAEPETQEPDVLDMLLAQDGGTGLTQPELRDQVVSLVAAGYETTSSAMAWAVFECARRPEVWQRLSEVETPATDEFTHGVVSEVLRLHPPAVIAARYAVENLTFDGYAIRRGNLVAYSPYLTQRDARWWERPTEFDPDRWRTRHDPYSYVTFGGGSRRCIGFGLATMQIAILLVETARHFQVELVSDSQPTPAGIASAYPREGVAVRVRRR